MALTVFKASWGWHLHCSSTQLLKRASSKSSWTGCVFYFPSSPWYCTYWIVGEGTFEIPTPNDQMLEHKGNAIRCSSIGELLLPLCFLPFFPLGCSCPSSFGAFERIPWLQGCERVISSSTFELVQQAKTLLLWQSSKFLYLFLSLSICLSLCLSDCLYCCVCLPVFLLMVTFHIIPGEMVLWKLPSLTGQSLRIKTGIIWLVWPSHCVGCKWGHNTSRI